VIDFVLTPVCRKIKNMFTLRVPNLEQSGISREKKVFMNVIFMHRVYRYISYDTVASPCAM
jgi:hypothetical protein